MQRVNNTSIILPFSISTPQVHSSGFQVNSFCSSSLLCRKRSWKSEIILFVGRDQLVLNQQLLNLPNNLFPSCNHHNGIGHQSLYMAPKTFASIIRYWLRGTWSEEGDRSTECQWELAFSGLQTTRQSAFHAWLVNVVIQPSNHPSSPKTPFYPFHSSHFFILPSPVSFDALCKPFTSLLPRSMKWAKRCRVELLDSRRLHLPPKYAAIPRRQCCINQVLTREGKSAT
jgi:hypothetical protein